MAAAVIDECHGVAAARIRIGVQGQVKRVGVQEALKIFQVLQMPQILVAHVVFHDIFGNGTERLRTNRDDQMPAYAKPEETSLEEEQRCAAEDRKRRQEENCGQQQCTRVEEL